jgi:hypothetical protein
MNIEITENEQIIDFGNVLLKDYRNELSFIMYSFSKNELDFSSIHSLFGNKEMLESSFQHQKKDSLNW